MAKNFYGVKRGVKPGIYRTWAETQQQVTGFPGAVYKGFETLAEVEAFVGRSGPSGRPAAPYIEVHDGTTVTRVDLTDGVRTALVAAGVALPR